MDSINIEETLTLDTDISSISVIEKLIDSQSQMLGIDDEVYGKYMLSVVECMNNAITHGNKNDKSKKIFVRYDIDKERIHISIEDQGDGFDPDSLPDPTAEENIDKDCGRGIFLMRHLSDGIEFSNGGRKVDMTFNLR